MGKRSQNWGGKAGNGKRDPEGEGKAPKMAEIPPKFGVQTPPPQIHLGGFGGAGLPQQLLEPRPQHLLNQPGGAAPRKPRLRLPQVPPLRCDWSFLLQRRGQLAEAGVEAELLQKGAGPMRGYRRDC